MFTLKPYLSAMFFYDDRMGQRQALPGAAPYVLCGKERLKNPGLDIFRYTRTAIFYDDLRPIIFAPGSDRDLAFSFRSITNSIGNRVRRINDQIKDHLIELSGQA